MRDERIQPGNEIAGEPEERRPWSERVWRPAGSAVAAALALLVTWHVINGQHGLSVWHKMRTEDHTLQEEIRKVQQENDELRKQNDKLMNDPEAIRHHAREQLHYAGPDEVIYTLPAAEVDKEK